eukprot:4028977-Amphidinium_carterae.1
MPVFRPNTETPIQVAKIVIRPDPAAYALCICPRKGLMACIRACQMMLCHYVAYDMSGLGCVRRSA